jgi:O-antigen/teichoic acid export membrane protein
MGAQRITVSSAIGTAMTTTSTLGAIAVLAWVSPTIEALFVWQAIVGILYALLMRHAAWRALGRDAHMAFNLGALRTIWRFSAGMALIGLLGLVFTQLDKVLLSRILPLADYGRYMIAVVVTGGLYVFVTPFFNAVYPRFSMLVAQGDTAGLETRYRLSTGLLTAILFPVAGFLSVFAVDVLTMWTRDADLARAAGPLVSLLAVGSALHGVMHLPHALQLAHGKTELPLIINGTLLVTFAPLIVVLAVARGATGGALAWLVLHSIYVVLSTWLTHRQLLTRLRWKWISRDVGTPFMVSAVVSVAAGWLATAFVFPGPRLAIGLLGIVVATSSCVALSTLVRHAALVRLKALAAHGFLSRTRAGVHP